MNYRYQLLLCMYVLSFYANPCRHSGTIITKHGLTKKDRWHQTTPTVGIIKKEARDLYLPYNFDLWQLAPNKGKGITLVLLDTGIAAITLKNTDAYKTHPDITYDYNENENYNCCNRGLKIFVRILSKFLINKRIVNEREIVPIIIDYCFNRSTTLLEQFLKKEGTPDLFKGETLSEKGKKVLFELTQGKNGIMPRNKIYYFTPVEIVDPVKQKAILEFLPLTLVYQDHIKLCKASHGTHLYGLIKGSMMGIAPDINCIMIKTCNDEGVSDLQTLEYALQKAKDLKADIVNISLLVDLITPDNQNIENSLREIPYVVAASGNEPSPYGEGYPARSPLVEFDVGAFCENNNYEICFFSQHHKNIGPKIVAPGLNIMSMSIPSCKGDYMVLSGTSMASALVSGFIGLVLSEFKDSFSRTQLLKVCYSSAKKLASSWQWDEKCLLGAIDMRTALFTLHVCSALKKVVEKDIFDKKFDAIVKAILTIIDELSLPKNVMITSRFYTNLSESCNYIVSLLVTALHGRRIQQPQGLFEKIRSLMELSEFDIFGFLNPRIRDRLYSAINKNC